MAKLPPTSKKSNLACLCVTAQLNNLGCTRKCFWHLFFSDSRRQPEQLGLCLPYLRTQENSSVRACAGTISWHTRHPASLPPEKDVVTRDCPPFSSALLAAWLIAIGMGLKESRLLALSRWRQAVMRATAWPKAVPEPSCERGGCWKLEFILGAEYSQGLRADFSPRLHTCSAVRAASLKEHSWPANTTSYSKLREQNTP